MSYRDDRDALQQRVEDLERELSQARRRLDQIETARAKTERLEAELSAAQRNLDRIRTEIHAVGAEEAPRRRSFAAAHLVMLGVVAWGVVAGVAMMRSARSSRYSTPAYRTHSDASSARVRHAAHQAPTITVAGQDDEPAFRGRVKRVGYVTAVSGDAEASIGDVCSVSVRPASGVRKTNCRVVVRCGETTLYGRVGAGYAYCDVREGAPELATDEGETFEDGDPMLALNLAAGHLIVSDEGETPYEVTLRLPPDEAD
jgi:hypothetical protein